MGIAAVIVAAGKSKRLKARQRKPFLKLGNYTILERAVSNFEKNIWIKNIVVVVHKDDVNKTRKLLRRFKKISSVVAGGKRRIDSVKKGTSYLLERDKIILIHDAARPLVSPALIKKVIREAKRWPCVIPGLRVSSTVKKVKKGFVKKTVDREDLFLAQTPQGLKASILKEVFDSKKKLACGITDEAFLFEVLGKKVKVIDGEASNIKITTQEDLNLARKLIK